MRNIEGQHAIESIEEFLKDARYGKGLGRAYKSGERVLAEPPAPLGPAEARKKTREAYELLLALIREPASRPPSLLGLSSSAVKDSIEKSVTRQIIYSLQATSGPMRTVLDSIEQLHRKVETIQRDNEFLKSQLAELAEAQSQQQSAHQLSRSPVLHLQANSLAGEISDLVDEEYELLKPIALIVELSGDKVIVCDEQINIYGCGTTLNEALEEYRLSIVEYFNWLSANESTLADHLKGHLDWLRQHMRRREGR